MTFAFGDPAAKLYGLARISRGGEEPIGLAILYPTAEPVAAGAGGGDAAATSRAGTTSAPPASRVRRRAARGVDRRLRRRATARFDLRFEACSAPAVLDAEAPVARAGGRGLRAALPRQRAR